MPVRCFFGDIRDPQSVRDAVRDCDTVFHTAGPVGVGPSLTAFMVEVHEGGTRNVLVAADRGARVIHTSSLVAVGSAVKGQPVTEETPFNLDRSPLPYVHAKRAAEVLALEAAGRGQDVVVVNPAYLVGPDDHERSAMGEVCHRFWRGRLPFAPPGGFNLVDVRDVAEGHILAAERGISGRRYLLGGEDHTFHSFLRLLSDAADRQRRWIPRVGRFGFGLLALVAELRARLLGKSPHPSWGDYHLNRHQWFCSSERARRELGFVARPLRESLRDTHRWYEEQRTSALAA
jgi:dihydroflavonol-4-reductase